MRIGRVAAVALALLTAPALGLAQDAGTAAPDAAAPATAAPETPSADPGTLLMQSPVLTIDPDRLFTGSKFGQRVEQEYGEHARKLADENRRIEADLTAQEKDLTERRAKLAPEEFRKLADAFDAKVEGIRAAQAAKSSDLDSQREVERKRFLQIALPILGDLVRETGAVAILNTQAIFLAFRGIDVTDRAIQRIDDKIGDGAQLEPAPGGDTTPTPDAAPGTPAPAPDIAPLTPPAAPDAGTAPAVPGN
ncbi:MAG: OmpH family outer membrane protein [Rhodobacteraceae bacterium]|nr:OmpH family outer membrane protein [Paracoccaceae bacterium]